MAEIVSPHEALEGLDALDNDWSCHQILSSEFLVHCLELGRLGMSIICSSIGISVDMILEE